MQLIWQLVIGSGIVFVTVVVQTVFIAVAMSRRPHLARRIGRPRTWAFAALLGAGALWMLISQTAVVWIWACSLIGLGAFDALEPAVYFALAAYTTLGFGDVLPPEHWRILGGLIGANGMLGFGLATAALVELVTGVRRDLGA